MHRTFLYAIGVLAMTSLASGSFVHPGMLHTQADFTRMAQKVAAKQSPWIDSYNKLIHNWHTGSGESSHAQTYINRGTGCSPNNIANLFNDAAAVYDLALLWKITGNASYAAQAVGMLNSWASTLTGIGCQNGRSHDFILAAGIQGYQFANAAEILRSYSGWTVSQFAAFKKMMVNVFLPINEQFPRPLSEYANWDLASYASILAIGILTDNTTLFNQAVNYYKTGWGNGAIAQAVVYLHPGHLGQGQEAGRDQGHATLDIAHFGVIAEMAWNQGVDLYSYGNNRLLAMSEYTAKSNLVESTTHNSTSNTTTYNYYKVPFSTYAYVNWPTVIYHSAFSTSAIGTIRPCWASIYNHYVNRKGLAANYTGIMMKLLTPDGGGPDYGTNSGGYDQLGFQSLTFTRDPISQGAAPSGLTGYLLNGRVVLSWWGSAYATSYSVRRGTKSGGPYTTIATGIKGLLSYTDNVAAGTYYYVVAANTSTTSVSRELKVVANPQTLHTYLALDATSGSSAVDTSGNGNNGNLVGSAIWVKGKTNNGVKLDGSTGYVNLPVGLITGLSDFTVASWLYLNSRSSWMRLFDFGYGTGRYMFFSPQGNNGNATFAITVNTGSGTQKIDATKPIPIGQWTHIAVTLKGTVGTIYMNGAVIGSSSSIQIAPFQLTNCTDLAAQNWIGRSQFSSDPHLNGIVDDFRIYYGALTAAQINALIAQSG